MLWSTGLLCSGSSCWGRLSKGMWLRRARVSCRQVRPVRLRVCACGWPCFGLVLLLLLLVVLLLGSVRGLGLVACGLLYWPWDCVAVGRDTEGRGREGGG